MKKLLLIATLVLSLVNVCHCMNEPGISINSARSEFSRYGLVRFQFSQFQFSNKILGLRGSTFSLRNSTADSSFTFLSESCSVNLVEKVKKYLMVGERKHRKKFYPHKYPNSKVRNPYTSISIGVKIPLPIN